jgi:hypothetical protein
MLSTMPSARPRVFATGVEVGHSYRGRAVTTAGAAGLQVASSRSYRCGDIACGAAMITHPLYGTAPRKQGEGFRADVSSMAW